MSLDPFANEPEYVIFKKVAHRKLQEGDLYFNNGRIEKCPEERHLLGLPPMGIYEPIDISDVVAAVYDKEDE